MKCRDCDTEIVPSVTTVDKPKTASQLRDCYYLCPSCGVGYSNAKTEASRRKIYPKPELNVPETFREHIRDVLACALNERNRGSKILKFAFETSEDAVTWTTIRYLQASGQLGAVIENPGFQPTTLLLWGTPYPSSCTTGSGLRRRLIEVENQLGEEARSRSEPDVILADDDRLVFIEVKYRSKNEFKPKYRGFSRYLAAATDLFNVPMQAVEEAGYYELVRNWVIGCHLAAELGVRFTLLNLAPESCGNSADRFKSSLRQSQGREFQFLDWRRLIGRLRQPLEPWFSDYVASRGLAMPVGELGPVAWS